MRATFVSLLLGIALLSCTPRQQHSRESSDATSFDGGGVLVDQLSKISHVFRLKNTGNRDLKITGVDKSCGCLDASIDRYSIAPGHVASLRLSAQVTPSYSDITARCIVKTDDKDIGDIAYSFAFTTYPRAQFRPLRFNIGTLDPPGMPGEKQDCEVDAWLDVFRAPGEQTDFVEKVHTPDGLRVEIGKSISTDEPAKGIIRTSYPVHGRIRRDLLTSMYAGQQELSCSAVTRRGERVSLSIAWTWRSPIEASPSRIHFGTVSGSRSDTRRLLIRSTWNRSFRILSITGDDAGSLLPITQNEIGSSSHASESHSLPLQLSVTNPNTRAAAGTFTIDTDDATCPKLSVLWSAFVDRN